MDSKKDKKQVKSGSQNDQLAQLKGQLETSKQQYLRALADYHNLEKRVYEGQEETVKQATRRVVLRLLPFLDNLEKAEVFVQDPGLKMIKDQFLKNLYEEGVEEIELTGKEFNPEEAEAVDVVLGEKDNVVAEVMQKGYKLFGKVIRPAQVKVTKKQ